MAYDKLPQGASLKPTPFKLHLPQEEVDHFYQLIKLSKLAPKTYESLQKDTIKFGVTHEWMTNAKKHWETSYDWRKREDRINEFPHFKVDVKDDDGFVFDMHFMALLSEKPDAIPIVFLHGWPGSFLEFLGVLDILRKKYTPDKLPYNVIVPSLPGYGLSSTPPLDKDFKTKDIARVIDKLMVGLGLSHYFGQGGDIGAYTCRPLSTHEACRGILLNFSMMPEPKNYDASEVTEEEKKGVKQFYEFAATQSAYALEHGTRPSTVGFSLAASPIALLPWIAEKFITWSDTTPPLDDILDSISLYWFTESFPRCIYPYREFHNSTAGVPYNIHADPQYHITKPFGYIYFPYELAPMPRAWVATSGNLVFYRGHTSGGHFAAMEKPQEMVDDVEAFIAQVTK